MKPWIMFLLLLLLDELEINEVTCCCIKAARPKYTITAEKPDSKFDLGLELLVLF